MTETPWALIQRTMSARSPLDLVLARYSDASGAMSMMDSATIVPCVSSPQLARPVGASVSVT